MLHRALQRWGTLSRQRGHALSLAALRIAYGLYWLRAAAWKVPPDFGQATDTGLWYWVRQEVAHPAFPWYRAFLEGFVVPNFTLVGYLVLFTECLIGLSLLLGLFTRLGTAIGALMSLNILLGVVGVPGETVWFYLALIGLHLLLGITRSGRTWGLDAHLAPRLERAAAQGSRAAAMLKRFT